MKAIISAMITCAVIFGLSAGATQYLIKQPETVSEAIEVKSDAITNDSQPSVTEPAEPMPVSFRPDNNVSIEAVLQMSDSIKRMEQDLALREQNVKRDEMRVKLLFDDLATEQDELRSYSEGIDSKIDLLGRMKAELEVTLALLDERKAEIDMFDKNSSSKTAAGGLDVDDRANHVKGWFEGLAPEQAAEYLREFSNNGKMSFAASLLQKMSDRQKSKILGAMNDPVLVDQLIESLSAAPKK